MSKAKAKGTAAETDVVKYLLSFPDHFPHAERRALAGKLDKGDVAGVPNWTIEIKAAERLALAAWQRETLTEQGNADTKYCCLIVKRKYKPVAQWDAYIPAPYLGYPVTFAGEDSWVRMDLALAVAYMAMTNL